jgi:predicted AAA+ superfamily ATPase
VDLALRNAILKLDENRLFSDSVLLGFYAENLVFNALRQYKGAIEISYYRDAKREVDFIVHAGGKQYLPVEVKYRETIDNADFASLQYFMGKFGQRFGIIVTKQTFQNQIEERKILALPLSVFLLLF